MFFLLLLLFFALTTCEAFVEARLEMHILSQPLYISLVEKKLKG